MRRRRRRKPVSGASPPAVVDRPCANTAARVLALPGTERTKMPSLRLCVVLAGGVGRAAYDRAGDSVAHCRSFAAVAIGCPRSRTTCKCSGNRYGRQDPVRVFRAHPVLQWRVPRNQAGKAPRYATCGFPSTHSDNGLKACRSVGMAVRNHSPARISENEQVVIRLTQNADTVLYFQDDRIVVDGKWPWRCVTGGLSQ